MRVVWDSVEVRSGLDSGDCMVGREGVAVGVVD